MIAVEDAEFWTCWAAGAWSEAVDVPLRESDVAHRARVLRGRTRRLRSG
jgi:hypothetical protein